jgi:hypothetical protein
MREKKKFFFSLILYTTSLYTKERKMFYMLTKRAEKMMEDFINSPIKQEIDTKHIENIKGDASDCTDIEDIGRRILCYIETYEPKTELQKNNINTLICSYIKVLSDENNKDTKNLNKNFFKADVMYYIYIKEAERTHELSKISFFLHVRKEIEKNNDYIFEKSEQYVSENSCRRDFKDAFLEHCLRVYDNHQIINLIAEIKENLNAIDEANETSTEITQELVDALIECSELNEVFELLLKEENKKLDKINSRITIQLN